MLEEKDGKLQYKFLVQPPLPRIKFDALQKTNFGNEACRSMDTISCPHYFVNFECVSLSVHDKTVTSIKMGNECSKED
jgi:hypothetical protein